MLPKSLVPELRHAAEPVVAKVLTGGGIHTRKPSGEVSAVRTLTLDGFDEIAAAWSTIIKRYGYRIDLRAVFCHSSPQVTFARLPHPKYPGGNDPRQCELADLLIVMDHVDPLKKIDERRAVLVQAKMLKHGAVKPSGNEWVQHELLAWLPPFTFVDSSYDSRSRAFNTPASFGSPATTAEYGGIDLNSAAPEWRHELTQVNPPWFHSPASLADYLAHMATGHPAYSRDAVRGGTDDWSFTVDELLRITAARPLTRKMNVARGNNNVVGFLVDTSLFTNDRVGGFGGKAGVRGGFWSIADVGGSGAGGSHDRDKFDDDSEQWPEGPISTIHLTLTSIEERTED